MAQFTAEHVLPTTGCIFMASCQVGDNIWVIEKVYVFKFKMHKFNISSGEWQNIEYENREQIECDPGTYEGRDFYQIAPWNDKIYLLRRYHNTMRILEFDINTLKWKTKNSINRLLQQKFFIYADKIYTVCLNRIMVIMCMNTYQWREVVLPLVNDSPQDNMALSEVNGLIILIRIQPTGILSVFEYNETTDEFSKFTDDVQQVCREFSAEPQYATFVWSTKTKMYVAMCYESNGLLICCLDLQTKKWDKVFNGRLNAAIRDIFGNDEKIYVTFNKTLDIAVREIDIEPKLQMLSLIRLADTTVESLPRHRIKSFAINLPIGLREAFEKVLTWKLNEFRKNRLENAKTNDKYIKNIQKRLKNARKEAAETLKFNKLFQQDLWSFVDQQPQNEPAIRQMFGTEVILRKKYQQQRLHIRLLEEHIVERLQLLDK